MYLIYGGGGRTMEGSNAYVCKVGGVARLSRLLNIEARGCAISRSCVRHGMPCRV